MSRALSVLVLCSALACGGGAADPDAGRSPGTADSGPEGGPGAYREGGATDGPDGSAPVEDGGVTERGRDGGVTDGGGDGGVTEAGRDGGATDGGVTDGGGDGGAMPLCERLAGSTCLVPFGVCATSVWSCEGTSPRCRQLLADGTAPGPEICTGSGAVGADEDCDGYVDEGCPCTTADDGRPCGTSAGLCGAIGVTRCTGGMLLCIGDLDPFEFVRPECIDGGVDFDCDNIYGESPGVSSGEVDYCI